MKSEKELFDLAKQYVMLSEEFKKELPEYEIDEIKKDLEGIRDILFQKGYDVDKFVEFQNLYREMSIADYYKFIKTL